MISSKSLKLFIWGRPGRLAVGFVLAAMPWMGCVGKAPVRRASVTPPPQAGKSDLESHLEGVWEIATSGGKTKTLIFEPGGSLKFEGGLAYFNPGRWELDPDRHELRITLPQAEDDKLQIFQTYVGNGVKALNRARKQVTYPFDSQTWTLNVGGWMYSKSDSVPAESVAEPVLQ